MRLAGALLLLVTAVRGQDLVAEVRDFIDAHRNEDSRRVYKAVVPVVPEAGDDPLVFEYRIGNHIYAYSKLAFVVREDDVDLVELRVNAREPGFPLPPSFKPGLQMRRATIPRGAYDALQQKIDLLHGAYLERRRDVKDDLPRNYRAAATGRGKLYLRLGDRVLVDTGLSPIPPEDIILRDVDERGTAVLLFRLVLKEVSGRDFVAVGNPSGVGALLLENLAEVTGWRRILRAMALAYLGHGEALPTLRKLEPQDEWVRGAAWMIRIPQLCEDSEAPPEQLMQLARHTKTDWGTWAEGFLKERYPRHFGRVVIDRFDSEDPAVRRRAIEELEKIDPKDLSLARVGLDDPAAQVRVEAARILGAWNVLLAIAKDKTLVDEDEFMARGTAMIYLSWLNPPRGDRGWVEPPGDRDVIGAALIEILLDGKEDFTVRSRAARALGNLGFDQAIPPLLKVVASPRPAVPVQLERGDRLPIRCLVILPQPRGCPLSAPTPWNRIAHLASRRDVWALS